MFDLSKNYEIARKIAAEGMILLKNEDGTLPVKNKKIGIVGGECLDLIRGGGGSATVNCAYVKTLAEGLREKAAEGKFILSERSIEFAAETEAPTPQLLNSLAGEIDTAIVTFKRYSSEGSDRRLDKNAPKLEGKNLYTGEAHDDNLEDYEKQVGYFCPSQAELALMRAIEESDIKSAVLILNISATVDISFIEKFKKIKAVLMVYLPGMEAGRAIADVLCGDVTPCGKLVDSIAYRYEDYPSSSSFNVKWDDAEYKEDIFVGYRYFETYAPEKVMYPFGFGLSYTEFELSDYKCSEENGIISVDAVVKNIGTVSGKEVVQVYSSAPKGELEKPAVELRGFAKTKLLSPGESEKITVTFACSCLASFDAEGVTGYRAAWVLEKGDYIIRVGNSVRNTYECGTYSVAENTLVEQLDIRFDGTEYAGKVDPRFKGECSAKEKISLYDVHSGKADIYEFTKQLSAEELVSLAHGQPPAFPLGTAGIGNLKKYDVPNPQTADGPAGIRRSVNTTCFPCGTLIACTWDKQLQTAMGQALGFEGVSTGIDIILAPSMNIHRNPLCGRNFEYLSEDPLVTGKTAATIVNGIQSRGLCATVKHFAVNNYEQNRRNCNSVVSERALREIYLRGFEIAIKESNPAFVMTSYNKLNGTHTSANAQLLRGVARDEWGYDGAFITDWRNRANLDDEIRAGNNVKMPFGYPDQAQLALDAYKKGELPIELLRENAAYVLKAVMKTNRFDKKDFGIKHTVENGRAEISVVKVGGISSTRLRQGKREDGVDYLYCLGKDQRAQRTFVYYVIDAPETGTYNVSAEVSTNCKETEIYYCNESGDRMGAVSCNIAEDANKWYTVETEITLREGENVLKVLFANDPSYDEPFFVGGLFPLPEEDVKFANLIITKK